jgi:hypothetical protein
MNIQGLLNLIADKLANDKKTEVLKESFEKILQELNTKVLLLHEINKNNGDLKKLPRDCDFFMGIPFIRIKSQNGCLIEVISIDAREVVFNAINRSNLWN